MDEWMDRRMEVSNSPYAKEHVLVPVCERVAVRAANHSAALRYLYLLLHKPERCYGSR